ncbi:MAG: hypothetical protein EOP84_20690, partial [Verrucomicrobiaceae bacterium]
MRCACGERPDCPHGYASIKELLDRAEVSTTLSKKDKTPKVDAIGKKLKTVAKEKIPSFEEIVEEKLGRSLTASEEEIASCIQKAFHEYRDSGQVPYSVIRPLLYDSGFYWYGGGPQEKMWASPPRNPWETWLYLAHFLQGKNRSWPKFLSKITTKAEVKAFVAPWEREKEIETWVKRLSGLEQMVDTPQAEPIDLRLVLDTEGARLEIRSGAEEKWSPVKKPRFDELNRVADSLEFANPESALLWAAFRRGNPTHGKMSYGSQSVAAFRELLCNPLLVDRIVTTEGQPLARPEEKLVWQLTEPDSPEGYYKITLAAPDGKRLPSALLYLEGRRPLYVTADTVYEATPSPKLSRDPSHPNEIPAPALETPSGIALLDLLEIPLPETLATRVKRVRARLVIEGMLSKHYQDEMLVLKFSADWGDSAPTEVYGASGWKQLSEMRRKPKKDLVRYDRGALNNVPSQVEQLGVVFDFHRSGWTRRVTRKFPELFSQWLLSLPEDTDLKLSPELASFRDSPVSGTFQLEIEPSGVDWFDVSTKLDIADVELSPEELKALLSAKGGWVRLGAK